MTKLKLWFQSLFNLDLFVSRGLLTVTINQTRRDLDTSTLRDY
jgi:hypothetical protein